MTILRSLFGRILRNTSIDLEAQQPRLEGPQALVDLCAVLIDIAHDAAFEAQHLQKSIVYEGEEHCLIIGNQPLLRSACENVIRNALLYTPPYTTIHISLARDARSKTAQIVIRDEGPVVPAKTLPHLFSSVDSKHPEDSGLAVARHIVTMHQGQITARNIAPHGLEVTLNFPLA